MNFGMKTREREPKPYTFNRKHSYIVIALGGSVVVPNGVNTVFLKKLKRFLSKHLLRGKKFILVIGGGSIARHYQNALGKIIRVPAEDRDWIGVHSTRFNAHLLRTVFRKEAYPVVLDNPFKQLERPGKKSLLIASGWKPGWSTDYIAMVLAKRFGVKRIIVAGHPPFVYTKDHMRFKNAKPIRTLSWHDYRSLIPGKWTPGLKSPVDPVAARFAERFHIEALIVRGTSLKNLELAIEGKPFRGTVIR